VKRICLTKGFFNFDKRKRGDRSKREEVEEVEKERSNLVVF